MTTCVLLLVAFADNAQVILSIDHDAVAHTGYKQTGPTMLLGELEARAGLGGLSPEGLGLYKDLEPFWERIGGDAIYKDAVDYVDSMWESGVLQTWADAATVVAAHDPHPAVLEGLEWIGFDVVDEDAAADLGGLPPDGAPDGDGGLLPDAALVPVPDEVAAMVGADDGADKPARLSIILIIQHSHSLAPKTTPLPHTVPTSTLVRLPPPSTPNTHLVNFMWQCIDPLWRPCHNIVKLNATSSLFEIVSGMGWHLQRATLHCRIGDCGGGRQTVAG